MPEARHRADDRSAARKGLLGALVSPILVAALFVGVLVAVSAFARAGADPTASPTAAPESVESVNLDEIAAQREKRDERASRSGGRTVQVAERIALEPAAVDQEFATAPLNIWRGPREEGPKIGVLPERSKVAVTGQQVGTWTEILLTNPERGRVARWVNGTYLAENKPKKEKPEPATSSSGGSSGGSAAPSTDAGCTNGTSVASGVSPNIVTIHQAVCAAFPEITTYGTFRSDGEHAQGLAVDIMVSGDRGWQVAEFIRNNYSQFGVSYLIYSQQIWSVDRSGEGWRGMEDRGSTTANHYDHVHVTVY
jgi:hypothetical protein